MLRVSPVSATISTPRGDRWLLRVLLSRRPHQVIHSERGVHLYRWYLIPRNRWCNVYLQTFTSSGLLKYVLRSIAQKFVELKPRVVAGARPGGPVQQVGQLLLGGRVAMSASSSRPDLQLPQPALREHHPQQPWPRVSFAGRHCFPTRRRRIGAVAETRPSRTCWCLSSPAATRALSSTRV